MVRRDSRGSHMPTFLTAGSATAAVSRYCIPGNRPNSASRDGGFPCKRSYVMQQPLCWLRVPRCNTRNASLHVFMAYCYELTWYTYYRARPFFPQNKNRVVFVSLIIFPTTRNTSMYISHHTRRPLERDQIKKC